MLPTLCPPTIWGRFLWNFVGNPTFWKPTKKSYDPQRAIDFYFFPPKVSKAVPTKLSTQVVALITLVCFLPIVVVESGECTHVALGEIPTTDCLCSCFCGGSLGAADPKLLRFLLSQCQDALRDGSRKTPSVAIQTTC